MTQQQNTSRKDKNENEIGFSRISTLVVVGGVWGSQEVIMSPLSSRIRFWVGGEGATESGILSLHST